MLQSHMDVINLSYYYNKKQLKDAIVYILPLLLFFCCKILVILCLFSCSAFMQEREKPLTFWVPSQNDFCNVLINTHIEEEEDGAFAQNLHCIQSATS